METRNDIRIKFNKEKQLPVLETLTGGTITYTSDYVHWLEDLVMGETVPNLSGATQEQKHLIIEDLTKTTAKAVLTVFVALGLKTHIEARVINDATGDEFLLKFNKIESV